MRVHKKIFGSTNFYITKTQGVLLKFSSTRNSNNVVSFSQAITNCISSDGGFYVPNSPSNLRPWIYYLNQNTSFSSLAGALTSAMIKEEFSPIISEAIATNAFPFSPELKQLDESLYELDLYTGPTGSHKDFGISYLAACLEYTLLMQDKTATVIAVCNKAIGSSVAHAMRGKTRLKAVLLYSKDTMKGFAEDDCIWNGGNIYPVEVEGTLDECSVLVKQLFEDKNAVEKYGLTLANTMNIGRLLPQTFFYMYAFSRLKEKVFGDIFYALAPGNYGNLVAGLYGWRFSLPVNGFITECTPSLTVDSMGKCHMMDAVIPLEKRPPANPGSPSNLERLEEVFLANPAVMKGLVFPQPVSAIEKEKACKDLFMEYGVFADPETAGAYAAARKHSEATDTQASAVVLVARDHPSFSNDTIRHWCGETVKMPDNIAILQEHIKPKKCINPLKKELLQILEEL